MSLANMLRQPVSIRHMNAYTLDEYGNTIPAQNGDPLDTFGYLELVDSVETLNDRDTVVTSHQLWLPMDVGVSAFDIVDIGGRHYEVDGAPWVVFNPRTGQESHRLAKLKVVE
jgi:hypothetical protein